MFSLILYGVSRLQKSKITVKSRTFETLKVQVGQDAGGVGTDMITMNATLRMVYRHTSTFFGVHVTSTPIDLSFSKIKVDSGLIKSGKFALQRNHRPISKNMKSINPCICHEGRNDSPIFARVKASFNLFFLARLRQSYSSNVKEIPYQCT